MSAGIRSRAWNVGSVRVYSCVWQVWQAGRVRHTRRWTRVITVPLLLALTGCAYYNGLYNANAAAKSAAVDARYGRDSLAKSKYLLSAESAESVLARYPADARRTTALYLAGRGEALGGDCSSGVPRLNEVLALAAAGTPLGLKRALNPREIRQAHALLEACVAQLQQAAEADSIMVANDAALLNAVRSASSITTIDSLIKRASEAQKQSRLFQRITEHILLFRLLVDDGNASAASQFMGAEVARDSLQAPLLAYATFTDIVRQMPATLLAPRALRAAALLMPENGLMLSARILRDYPSSAVASWMRGEDSGTQKDFAQSDSLLRMQWSTTARLFADSVARLRRSRASVSTEAARTPPPDRRSY